MADHIKAIPGDIRACAVTAVLGLPVIAYSWLYADPEPNHYKSRVNENGYAMPFPGLLKAVNRENPHGMFVTEPAVLEQVRVCEQPKMTSGTARQILEEYVANNADCFRLDRVGENDFVIRPNLKSGAIRQDAAGWLCKCNAP